VAKADPAKSGQVLFSKSGMSGCAMRQGPYATQRIRQQMLYDRVGVGQRLECKGPLWVATAASGLQAPYSHFAMCCFTGARHLKSLTTAPPVCCVLGHCTLLRVAAPSHGVVNCVRLCLVLRRGRPALPACCAASLPLLWSGSCADFCQQT
jgi:hypothetical protein